jgi:hypothetical protein
MCCIYEGISCAGTAACVHGCTPDGRLPFMMETDAKITAAVAAIRKVEVQVPSFFPKSFVTN